MATVRRILCCFPKLKRSIIVYEFPPDYKRVTSRRTLNENGLVGSITAAMAGNKRIGKYFIVLI